MSRLIRTPNLRSVDDVYQQLLALHEGLSEEQSLKANARLILALANHIGDEEVLHEAIALARAGSKAGSDEH